MNEMLNGALEVLRIINENGYEAYIVGGYTRDYLLNMESDDIDITTSASPEVIEKLFSDHFNKSLKYNTVTVRVNSFDYEVTTYRHDLWYSDHRHTKTIITRSLKKDLKRRDFTINALCLDKELNLIDLINGEADLNNKIIRAIGNPSRRFSEDALRMFRAFRFASRFYFEIEPKTYLAIKDSTYLVQYLSKERVRTEIEKIISEQYVFNYIPQMLDCKLLRYTPNIEKALKFLYSNYQTVDIFELISLSLILSQTSESEILVSKKEERYIEGIVSLVKLIRDRLLTSYDIFDYDLNQINSAIKLSKILCIKSYSDEYIISLYNNLSIKSLKELDLNGDDIIKTFNLKNSPLIGEYIDKALLYVLNYKIENKKNILLQKLKEEYNG